MSIGIVCICSSSSYWCQGSHKYNEPLQADVSGWVSKHMHKDLTAAMFEWNRREFYAMYWNYKLLARHWSNTRRGI